MVVKKQRVRPEPLQVEKKAKGAAQPKPKAPHSKKKAKSAVQSGATAKVEARSRPARPNRDATATARQQQPSPASDETFERIRKLCLALPDTKLTMTWGEPHFRVGDKIFCGFGREGERAVLGVKLEPEHARTAVKEARFWPAPYVGKHGWVSMDVGQRRDWEEVESLIRESYRLIAPKASRKKRG